MLRTGAAMFAGFIIGVLGTIFVGAWSTVYRGHAAAGVVTGIGIGLGAVLGLAILNWVVGYLDRVASGKA